MDLEESFAAYAALRWSMLYRLATLLGGAERADALTRAALVRAFVSWNEAQQAPSTDAFVKQLLTREVVGDAPRRHRPRSNEERPTDPAPALRGDLWDEIARLLPRQRATLVLRHYEGLDHADIAAAVGSSARAVWAELLALEAGIDRAELRELLLTRSDDTKVPHPPVDALVSSGHEARHRRRRRAWSWAVAVAAVVAAGLGVATLLQDASPATDGSSPRSTGGPGSAFLSGLPSGARPQIAYTVGRTLHLPDGRQVVLADPPTGLVQTQTWLFVATSSGAIQRVDPATGSVQTVTPASYGELLTDPSGEHLAWLTATPGSAVVALRTVADWAVPISDEQAFPARPRCCDNPFVLNGLTQDGRLIASMPAAGRAWVWTTPDGGRQTVREITGLDGGQISQVTSLGVVVRRSPLHYAVGVLDRTRFRTTAVLTAREAEFADPLGRRVVYVDATGGIHVGDVDLDAGGRGRSRRGPEDVTLLPDLIHGFDSARWEDADHVLLEVSDASLPYGALVRCAVDDGACEVAARLPDGPHLVAR